MFKFNKNHYAKAILPVNGHTRATNLEPLPYEIPTAFLQFEKGVDKLIGSMLSAAKLDEHNASFFDAPVDAAYRQAQEALQIQKAERNQGIHYIIEEYGKEEITCREQLKTIQANKAELMEERNELRSMRKSYIDAGKPFWKRPPVLICLVIAFTCSDALCLYNVLNNPQLREASIIVKALCVSTCLILNFAGLLFAHLWHQYRHTGESVMLKGMVVIAVVFAGVYAATVWLRVASLTGDDDFSRGVCALLSLSPLATSAINTIISLLSEDRIGSRLGQVEKQLAKLTKDEEVLLTKQVQLSQAEDRFSDLLKLNQERFEATMATLESRASGIKAYARYCLAQNTNSPDAVSSLSHDALRIVNGDDVKASAMSVHKDVHLTVA